MQVNQVTRVCARVGRCGIMPGCVMVRKPSRVRRGRAGRKVPDLVFIIDRAHFFGSATDFFSTNFSRGRYLDLIYAKCQAGTLVGKALC